MTEQEFEGLLRGLITGDPASYADPLVVVDDEHLITEARTFGEAKIPMMNRGLVITTGDGSEFQVTIVRSG